MALHRITSIAAALLLSGCPIPPVDGNPDGGALNVEVGTFDEAGRFVAFPGSVRAERGNQGGMHVGVAYRLPEGGVGDLTLNLEVRRSTDGSLVSSATRDFFVGYAGPGWTSEAVRVFMCPPSSQGPLDDAPLKFEVTVTGKKTPGVLGSASTTATFLCPLSSPMCGTACW